MQTYTSPKTTLIPEFSSYALKLLAWRTLGSFRRAYTRLGATEGFLLAPRAFKLVPQAFWKKIYIQASIACQSTRT